MFTFVSVIHQNFEYNLRILANFCIKTQKSMEFACTFSKSYSFFFFGFFKKDYTFYTKKSIFYNERCSKFRENQFFSNIFIFLSVIRQDFEYNKNFSQFSHKNSNIYDFVCTFSKNYSFFGLFNKDYTFYTKNQFFTTKDAQSFVKISFLVTFLYF